MNANCNPNRKRGFTIWLTGLSGVGKTTLGKMLAKELNAELLDGDEIRALFYPELGFSMEDRRKNILRIAHIANILNRNGANVVVAAISPDKSVREEAKRMIKSFIEIFLDASIDVLQIRDTKGLYKKADNGELLNLTGVNQIYEKPDNPDLRLDTGRYGVLNCFSSILKLLEKEKWI